MCKLCLYIQWTSQEFRLRVPLAHQETLRSWENHQSQQEEVRSKSPVQTPSFNGCLPSWTTTTTLSLRCRSEKLPQPKTTSSNCPFVPTARHEARACVTCPTMKGSNVLLLRESFSPSYLNISALAVFINLFDVSLCRLHIIHYSNFFYQVCLAAQRKKKNQPTKVY